jgi:hypothetical protein
MAEEPVSQESLLVRFNRQSGGRGNRNSSWCAKCAARLPPGTGQYSRHNKHYRCFDSAACAARQGRRYSVAQFKAYAERAAVLDAWKDAGGEALTRCQDRDLIPLGTNKEIARHLAIVEARLMPPPSVVRSWRDPTPKTEYWAWNLYQFGSWLRITGGYGCPEAANYGPPDEVLALVRKVHGNLTNAQDPVGARSLLLHCGYKLRHWFGLGLHDNYGEIETLRRRAFGTSDNLERMELALEAWRLLERIDPLFIEPAKVQE